MFFKHFGTIIMFAILGTLIATFLTSFLIYLVSYTGLTTTPFDLVSCFAFGSLISATDPVAILSIFKELNTDLMLYILVFGESILNDAISIILYQ